MNKPTQQDIDEFVCYCYETISERHKIVCTLNEVIAAVDAYIKICELRCVRDFDGSTYAKDEVCQILMNQRRAARINKRGGVK